MSGSEAKAVSAQREPLPLGRTLLVAILIEFAVVLAAASLVARAAIQTERPTDPPIMMVMEVPPPEVLKVEPKPLPKPVERTVLVSPLPVRPVIVPPVEAAAPVNPVVAAAPLPPSDSPIVEVPPPAPPPPVRTASTTTDKELEFAARLKAAIQAAVSYPAAAREMGFRGKARVEFLFRDGTLRQARIVQTSGNGMIDRAALAAVTNALCPPAPETLHGMDLPYQVTVMFELNAGR
jgi:protein TonB